MALSKLNAAGLAQFDGDLAFDNGNGIDFSATEGSNASSSVLDDYEEGTWTPTVSNHSGTSGTVAGRYTIIGKLFTFQGVFVASSGTISGTLELGGFPFAAASTFGHISINTSSSSVIQMSACRVVSGDSSFDIKQFDGDDISSGTGAINMCFSGAFVI